MLWIVLGCLLGGLLPGILLGTARAARDVRELKSVNQLKAVSSSYQKHTAVLALRKSENSRYQDEYVVLLGKKKLYSPEEIQFAMKMRSVVFRASLPNEADISLAWPSDSELLIKCSNCTSSRSEVSRELQNACDVMIRYDGFPPPVAYTDNQPSQGLAC